ncbi:hypothetical protein V5799_023442 [Amblyomma americanum]|uniref:Uncharacterized protein n=1 Tax=Amblyomma americanum TaxID=6943 RepID=A0AAQ4FJ98_AMBAM
MALSVVDSNGDPIDTGSIVGLTVVRGPRRGAENGENFGILLSQTVKLPSTNERAFLISSNHDSGKAAVLHSSSRRCRCDVSITIGRSSAEYFSHEAEFGAVALNGPYPCGTGLLVTQCVRYGVLSYGCPAGAVCVPDGAYHGVWAEPGTCFWGI